MDQKITLVEALTGTTFFIQHMDNRILKVSTHGMVIKPGQYKRIANEGMSQKNNLYTRGDLFIHFDVVFPEVNEMSTTKMQSLITALPRAFVHSMPTPKKNPLDMSDDDSVAGMSANNSTKHEEVEEVHLHDVEAMGNDDEQHERMEDQQKEAYDEDDDEHQHRGGGGAQQCRAQ